MNRIRINALTIVAWTTLLFTLADFVQRLYILYRIWNGNGPHANTVVLASSDVMTAGTASAVHWDGTVSFQENPVPPITQEVH